MKRKVYLLIGPYSAVGGVNIHIMRLSKLLYDNFDIRFINESSKKINQKNIFNLRTKNIFKYINFIFSSDIIHIHTGVWWLRIVHIIFARLMGKRIIVTIHSLTNLQTRNSRYLTSYFINLADNVVAVSEKIKLVLKIKQAKVLPAFIPPIINDESDLPRSIVTILSENYEKIIVSNASNLIIHNNQDLYGIDLLIEVAIRLKKDQLNYKIIFVIASTTKNKEMLRNYKEIIIKNKIESFIKLVVQPISFVKLIMNSDLVIRATNSDGDAISIREALYFQKPVIASNIVKRPEGVVVFKNRDVDDLYRKIKKVISKETSLKNKPININLIKKKYLELISS